MLRGLVLRACRGLTSIALALIVVTGLSSTSASAQPLEGRPAAPIVIAHRGASGYLPEHTLPSYAMAHAQSADYIEPDLVRTRDGAFICLHDIYLEPTTDIAKVYPDRARDDGRWYAADFTLDEVRRLRVTERLDRRFPRGTARFAVPTFEEMIELVAGLNQTTGRRAGIYPELKAPAWHRAQGLAMEEPFLAILRRYGVGGPGAPPIFIQSFEPEPLRELRRLGAGYPQIFLLDDDGAPRLTDAGLDEIATFANGIGPAKTLVEQDPTLVERAHRRRLAVHPYTFRADDVPARYGSFESELAAFYGGFGVDGLFTDFPDLARKWLAAHAAVTSR
jgi:glycerophosphoryl diester phosphodiesterase